MGQRNAGFAASCGSAKFCRAVRALFQHSADRTDHRSCAFVQSPNDGRAGIEWNRQLRRVVEDDPDGVTHPGPNATDTVAEFDAIRPSCALDRPSVDGEGHSIALAQ
jgi:hypothetical protein